MKKITVKDLGRVVTGHTPPTSKREFYGNSYPFVKPTDMNIGAKFTYETEEGYSDLAAEKYKNSMIPKGATCVVCIGTLGEKMTMAHCDLFTNQSVNSIIPSDDYDENYVYYLLKHNLSRVKALNKGTASGREFVSKSTFLDLEIEVYEDIVVQRKIGKILSAYDELIENKKKQICLLEETAQRLYKEWFEELHFPGYEDTSIIDGIPRGWNKRTLSELASVLRRGISPKYSENGQYMVINQKCIRSSVMNMIEARRQEKKYAPELNLADEDTIICSTGTGTLGRVGQVYGKYPDTTFDSHVTLVRAKEYTNLLYQSIKAKQDYLMSMGRGSTNQQELYKSVIEEMTILWPSDDIAERYEKIVSTIHKQITDADAIIRVSIEARDRLLSKMMSGELNF